MRNELFSTSNELLSRCNELLSTSNDLLSTSNELLSSSNQLRLLLVFQNPHPTPQKEENLNIRL